MTAQENLARVVSDVLDAHLPEDQRSGEPTVVDEEVAAAVVAFLTSDEATEAHAVALKEHDAERLTCFDHDGVCCPCDDPDWHDRPMHEHRAHRSRAAILAACGVESIPEHPAHRGHEFGGGYARAAALAAGDPDWQNATGGSLPLDPEPFVHDGWRSANRYDPVFGTAPSGIFAPRPGTEQRREFYEKGAE